MMSSTVARTFVRSTQRLFAARALASSRETGNVVASGLFAVKPQWRPESNRRVELPNIFQQPGVPMFVGFAQPLPKEDPNSFLESIDQEDYGMPTGSSYNEALQMMNRNGRSSKRHKANHGKRPCNRNARRAKKIKLGRRRRS